MHGDKIYVQTIWETSGETIFNNVEGMISNRQVEVFIVYRDGFGQVCWEDRYELGKGRGGAGWGDGGHRRAVGGFN